MEGIERSGPETHEKFTWSVAEGNFEPASDFPDPHEINVIKDQSANHANEEVKRRVLYTELLLYALKRVNPSIGTAPVREKQVIKFIINEMAGTMYHLGEIYRKQDVKEIAEKRIDEPMSPAQEVPVMQALRAMQEAGAIDYETRTILDAVVRGLYIKQTAGQTVE